MEREGPELEVTTKGKYEDPYQREREAGAFFFTILSLHKFIFASIFIYQNKLFIYKNFLLQNEISDVSNNFKFYHNKFFWYNGCTPFRVK